MTDCPACGANMRLADLHCQHQDCIWLKCGGCSCVISDNGAYYGVLLWGNESGYLKG